jgi:hypothetical protein
MDSSCVYAAAFRLHFGRRDVGLVYGLWLLPWGRPVGSSGCQRGRQTQSITAIGMLPNHAGVP